MKKLLLLLFLFPLLCFSQFGGGGNFVVVSFDNPSPFRGDDVVVTLKVISGDTFQEQSGYSFTSTFNGESYNGSSFTISTSGLTIGAQYFVNAQTIEDSTVDGSNAFTVRNPAFKTHMVSVGASAPVDCGDLSTPVIDVHHSVVFRTIFKSDNEISATAGIYTREGRLYRPHNVMPVEDIHGNHYLVIDFVRTSALNLLCEMRFFNNGNEPIEFNLFGAYFVDQVHVTGFQYEPPTEQDLVDHGIELYDFSGKWRDSNGTQYVFRDNKVWATTNGFSYTSKPEVISLQAYLGADRPTRYVIEDNTIEYFSTTGDVVLEPDDRPNTIEFPSLFTGEGTYADPVYSTVDPSDPVSYLTAFIADGERHGVDMSFIDLSDLSDFRVGDGVTQVVNGVYASAEYNCNNTKPQVMFNERLWYAAPETEMVNHKIAVLWHELGHSLFGLNHVDVDDMIMSAPAGTDNYTCDGIASPDGGAGPHFLEIGDNFEQAMDDFWAMTCAPSIYTLTDQCN